MERFFLYDDVEDTKTRFVSFAGKTQRYDLAILQSSRFFGKVLVLDIQFGRFAIIGSDDVEEPGYLEHVYNRTEEETEDLREYLRELLRLKSTVCRIISRLYLRFHFQLAISTVEYVKFLFARVKMIFTLFYEAAKITIAAKVKVDLAAIVVIVVLLFRLQES